MNTEIREEKNVHPAPATFLFRGILAAMFGVISLLVGEPTLYASTLWIAAYFFADGVSALSLLPAGKKASRRWPIYSGGAGILAGAATFLNPTISVGALALTAGIWALALGFFLFLGGVQFKRGEIREHARRIFLCSSGLVNTALAILILSVPDLALSSLLLLIAMNAFVTAAHSFFFWALPPLLKAEEAPVELKKSA